MTYQAHVCQDLAWSGWGTCRCGADRAACTDCGTDMTRHAPDCTNA